MTRKIEQKNPKISVSNLPDSLQHLIFLLSQTKNITPQQVDKNLQEAQVQPQDLLHRSTFDHPATHSYGRQLVYDGGYFEIMVMSWVPGDISAIHDHGATQWGAVQCFGRADHWSYQLNDLRLQTREHREITYGQIIKVSHELIHQMGNYSQDYFLSLHVYGISQESGLITGNARIFDLYERSIQYTDGGVFFCLPEEDISRKNYGLSADPVSALRHHQQMYARIRSILQTSSVDLEYWQAKEIALAQEISKLGKTVNSN